ncbi:MAG: SpoIIE family protein phosphatase, partial [Thermoleophilia bacterium]|nr:SpoIIE family protein phosphatase [Thermoleophilia bacterium]
LPEEWGLLLYSDGIVDARTAPGSRSRLGLAGLRAAVSHMWERRATSAADLQALVDSVQGGEEAVLDDDVTLLLLTGKATPVEAD